MADILLEVCVDSADGLQAAIEGGADRIELCAALELGGLTPDPGLMKIAAASPIPVHVMIRPRSGSFIYGPADAQQMLHAISQAREIGLAGVVFGALGPDMRLDRALLGRLCRHAAGLDRTLHRAFDCTGPDYLASLATAISLGFDRVLTSGGQATAQEGMQVLEKLFAVMDDKIALMPGSGITPDNAAHFAKRLPLKEIHASCSVTVPQTEGEEARLGFANSPKKQTSADKVRALKAALQAA